MALIVECFACFYAGRETEPEAQSSRIPLSFLTAKHTVEDLRRGVIAALRERGIPLALRSATHAGAGEPEVLLFMRSEATKSTTTTTITNTRTAAETLASECFPYCDEGDNDNNNDNDNSKGRETKFKSTKSSRLDFVPLPLCGSHLLLWDLLPPSSRPINRPLKENQEKDHQDYMDDSHDDDGGGGVYLNGESDYHGDVAPSGTSSLRSSPSDAPPPFVVLRVYYALVRNASGWWSTSPLVRSTFARTTAPTAGRPERSSPPLSLCPPPPPPPPVRTPAVPPSTSTSFAAWDAVSTSFGCLCCFTWVPILFGFCCGCCHETDVVPKPESTEPGSQRGGEWSPATLVSSPSVSFQTAGLASSWTTRPNSPLLMAVNESRAINQEPNGETLAPTASTAAATATTTTTRNDHQHKDDDDDDDDDHNGADCKMESQPPPIVCRLGEEEAGPGSAAGACPSQDSPVAMKREIQNPTDNRNLIANNNNRERAEAGEKTCPLPLVDPHDIIVHEVSGNRETDQEMTNKKAKEEEEKEEEEGVDVDQHHLDAPEQEKVDTPSSPPGVAAIAVSDPHQVTLEPDKLSF